MKRRGPRVFNTYLSSCKVYKQQFDRIIKRNYTFLAGDLMRVTTPTATEMMLPWKRDEEDESGPIQQAEFPSWASNKEYLAYNSPSATFLGGLGKF